jgi:hypothetical protein
VVIGPCLFEAVREKFDRLSTFGSPDEKADCRCAKTADQPKDIFHAVFPFVLLRCWMRGRGFRCLHFCLIAWVAGTRFRRCEGNGYTLDMDSVRFGRALGIGARAAARTLVTAVDAATTPNPSGSAGTPESAGGPAKDTKAATAGVRMGQQAARTTSQVRQTGKGLKEGGKRFGEAVWGPFVKLSGVLWLELTGVFFGIFALFAAGGVWKMRGEWWQTAAANHDARTRLIAAAAMAVLFGYFCVSSFVKARRRERRR